MDLENVWIWWLTSLFGVYTLVGVYYAIRRWRMKRVLRQIRAEMAEFEHRRRGTR